MQRFWTTVVLMMFAAGAAEGAEPQMHSKVDVTRAASGANLTLTFKVLPTDGLHINLDGPWKLQLKSHDGLALAQETLVKKDLDEKLTGFVVTTTAAPAKAQGNIEYTLIAFVCTNNQTACYRDVHTGKTPWSVAAK